MNEQNNLQPNEPIQGSKNIWIIIISIVITAIIVGGGVYMWQYSIKKNEKQKLQNEIVELNQKIVQLEKEDEKIVEPTGKNDIVDNMKLRNLTRYCSNVFSNYNQPVDETIINTLNAKSNEFRKYTDQGYGLSEVCKYGNKILFFLDLKTEFIKIINEGNETELEELYESAENTVIGIASSQYNLMNFYPIKVDGYRIGEGYITACNFDKYEDNKILYICVNANDGGTSKTWYAYEINQQNNIKVKYTYQGRYDSSRDEEEVLDSELLNLFSVKD